MLSASYKTKPPPQRTAETAVCSAYVSIRQAYVSIRQRTKLKASASKNCLKETSCKIKPLLTKSPRTDETAVCSAYVQHTSSIRQHTSAYTDTHKQKSPRTDETAVFSAYFSIRPAYVSIRQHTQICTNKRAHELTKLQYSQHTSAYVQYTSAYVSIHRYAQTKEPTN